MVEEIRAREGAACARSLHHRAQRESDAAPRLQVLGELRHVEVPGTRGCVHRSLGARRTGVTCVDPSGDIACSPAAPAIERGM